VERVVTHSDVKVY